MSISFNDVPSNLRVPFAAVEFDSSQAQQGPALLAYRALLIGQKRSAGSAEADSIVRCTSPEHAITLAGRGSMLHRMAIAWFASNRSTDLCLGVLADDEYGDPAEGTIVVSGTASANGVIPLYLGGERIPVAVTSGQAAAAIATAIGAAINAAADLPVTASVNSTTVTVTFRHAGEVGNSYDIRDSFLDGDELPAGIDLAITPLSGGAGNPVLSGLIAAMESMWFHVWAHPYTDATSLTAIKTELADRFGPMRSMDGVAITSAAGSFGTLTSLGGGHNSPHLSIVAQPGPSPLTPPMEFAAEVAALVAKHGATDPARPFQTLAMSHATPIAEADQFSLEERNLLLFDGISTTRLVVDQVQLERVISTYQTSPGGAADTAYLDITTLLTLMYLRYSFRVRFQTKYPRHKLADDGTRVGSGQAVMTPKLGKGEALTWFREMEELGLVENFEQFRRDLVVERNGPDRNRLDFLLPTDLINFLAVTAAQVQFRL